MNFNVIPWIIALIAGGVIIGWTVHIKHKLDQVPVLEAQLKDTKTVLSQTQAAYKKSEDLRKQEQKQATASVVQIQKSCDARIIEAKRSAGAIRTLTHETVKVDRNHCPVRELMDAKQLRDALGARG